jgi:hypothetical protein
MSYNAVLDFSGSLTQFLIKGSSRNVVTIGPRWNYLIATDLLWSESRDVRQ